MVFIAPFVGAVSLLSGLVSALPRPQDSAIGEEVAVSAPNGIPLTDTIELASQLASESQVASKEKVTDVAGNYGGAYASVSWEAVAAITTSASASHETQAASEAEVTHVVTSSVSHVAAVSTSAWEAYSTPTYGSGSFNAGGSEFDDCVAQCIATFGAPAAAYVPTATSGSDGSAGTGATHTVIVAPTQGVLRYVPFALNASVGDTIKFIWGANNHTVTKSSALTPCNKTGDALFASGIKDKDFVFTQVVNDTNPTYFHCATPGHCQNGMFGIINPPNALGSPSSVSGKLQSIGSSNPDVAAYAAYTTKQTASDAKASKWGGSIDLAALPDWSHALVTENVLYTRNFLASNSEVLQDNGSIDLSNTGTTPLMIPQDISAALNNAGDANAPSSPSPSASIEAPAPTGDSESLSNSNGASSLASPRILVGFVVAVLTFFAL